MAVLATLARLEQGGWYGGPDGGYRRYPFFSERAAWVDGQTAAGNKIGVAGCAWGYLVDELRKRGREAYGFDAASYATLKWAQIRPAETTRVVVADARTRTQMTSFRTTTAGMAGAALIPLVVTEDLLPCLTDAEVTTVLAELRRIAAKLVHICTCALPTTPGGLVNDSANVAARSADFNWKTHAEWKRLVGADLVMNAEGGAVL